jgi:hypothetical protein
MNNRPFRHPGRRTLISSRRVDNYRSEVTENYTHFLPLDHKVNTTIHYLVPFVVSLVTRAEVQMVLHAQIRQTLAFS